MEGIERAGDALALCCFIVTCSSLTILLRYVKGLSGLPYLAYLLVFFALLIPALTLAAMVGVRGADDANYKPTADLLVVLNRLLMYATWALIFLMQAMGIAMCFVRGKKNSLWFLVGYTGLLAGNAMGSAFTINYAINGLQDYRAGLTGVGGLGVVPYIYSLLPAVFGTVAMLCAIFAARYAAKRA